MRTVLDGGSLTMGMLTGTTRRSSTVLFWTLLYVSGVAFLLGAHVSQAQEAIPQTQNRLVFAVVPKAIDNDFFLPVAKGCHEEARRISTRNTIHNINTTVLCEVLGPLSTDRDTAQVQYDILIQLLLNDTVAGIAISVEDQALLTPLFLQNAQKKPLVTFDSDILAGNTYNNNNNENKTTSSLRHAYIGTNNTFMGKEIARMMIQLHPQVGTYAILSSGINEAKNINIQQRLEGFVSELDDRKQGWQAVEGSPGDAQDNLTIALEVLDSLAVQNPTCIVSLLGLPMRVVTNPTDQTSRIPWQAFHEKHQHRNITFLSIDAMPHQLELLASGYVSALVGQSPHKMGTLSISTLYEIVMGQDTNGDGLVGAEVTDSSNSKDTDDLRFLETNIISHTFMPTNLPDKEVEANLLGNLCYLGYSLFGVIFLTAFALMHWTVNYRNVRVVQVAQPKFLGMIILGVVVLAACLVPLSMDDGGDPDNLSDQQAIWICMGSPWLVSIGFTTTFSALYAKTRRINIIFHSDSAFARVKVSEREFLIPFMFLLICNIIVLTCWTVIDPLMYQRRLVLGEDGWNRVLSTYGVCRSDAAENYVIPMAILNLGVLIAANWQAFEARHLEAEFSETKYIGICMASMLQAVICGVPVLFVVRDNPQAYYMVLVFMVFFIGMTLLLVIFLPKIMFAQIFLAKSEGEQRDFISFIIQQSSHQRRKREKKEHQHTQQSIVPESPGLAAPSTTSNRWTSAPQTEELTSPSRLSRWQPAPQSQTPVSLPNEDVLATSNSAISNRLSNQMSQISEEPSELLNTNQSTAGFLLNTGQSVNSAITTSSSFVVRSGASIRDEGWLGNSHRTLLDPSEGEDGMLVYRTVSVCADGTITQASLHSMHQLSSRSLAHTTQSSQLSLQSPRLRDKMEKKSSWKSFFSSSYGGSSGSLNSHGVPVAGRSVDDGPARLRPVRKTISNGSKQKVKLMSTVLRAINEKNLDGSDNDGSQLSEASENGDADITTTTSNKDNQPSLEVGIDGIHEATVASVEVGESNRNDDDDDDAIFMSAHMDEGDQLAESNRAKKSASR